MSKGNEMDLKGSGTRWRILAHQSDKSAELENQGVFDELVLDEWLHLEKMDVDEWWLRIGDARIWVSRDESGKVQVDIERGCYGPILGSTKDQK
jgi:hypothetical protein